MISVYSCPLRLSVCAIGVLPPRLHRPLTEHIVVASETVDVLEFGLFLAQKAPAHAYPVVLIGIEFPECTQSLSRRFGNEGYRHALILGVSL